MPYGEYAECPNCGKTAHGVDEIRILFGYRNMGDGRVIPQSWCRECRSSSLINLNYSRHRLVIAPTQGKY